MGEHSHGRQTIKNANMGQFLGIALIFGGLAVGIIILVLMNVYRSENSLSGGAATLGIALGFLFLVFPQLGFGAFFLWQGQRETAVATSAVEQRQLLDMVKARGQVTISDLVIELNSSREQVQKQIHSLVGMGIFSGYINWQEGVLYSRQASELRQLERCYNCNGELELAGHGVINCPYCGTEYFLE